jgi:hypothetical protein
MDEMNEDEMLAELGVPIARKPARARTPREERIIAGFEDIVKFFEQHGRPPRHGDERDIFERLYAVRLDRLREQDDCRELLSDIDTHGLLTGAIEGADIDALDDEAMLAELGVAAPAEGDLTNLKQPDGVRRLRQIQAAVRRG